VFLETFGVFLGGFAFLLLMELLFFGVHAEGTIAAAATSEILMWTLVVTIAYPLIRGMRRPEWRRAMGPHTGEGVKAELIAGLVGYLGAQPLVWIGSVIGNMVEAAAGGADSEAVSGWGMFESPTQGTGILFWLGIMSAVIWAPLVEESIFRGALFRHLSGRVGLLWTAVITAVCFGFIHPYTSSGLIQVASGGVAFGLMRAWRGSLIAPMTAHAIHNAVVSLMPAVLIGMLG
jgi:membrane protease YdiL (CAAX protease family)